MLEFFYQSIETLREVKKPSKDEIIKMTVITLIVIAVAAVLFAIVDYLFLHLQDDFLYNFLNNLFNK